MKRCCTEKMFPRMSSIDPENLTFIAYVGILVEDTKCENHLWPSGGQTELEFSPEINTEPVDCALWGFRPRVRLFV